MKPSSLPVVGGPGARRGLPSQDGLRLILAGTGYLVLIALLQLVVAIGRAGWGVAAFPDRWFDLRDVVALFGWVGLMISGVSVIIVPNHFRVALEPGYLPTFHLAASNIGLIGLFASTAIGWNLGADGFLALVSVSFLAFGAGMLRTVAPFLRASRGPARPRLSAAGAADPVTSAGE